MATVRANGSEAEARKWVNTPAKSTHVNGKAVDVGPTAADVATTSALMPIAENKGLKLSFKVPEQDLTIRTDRRSLSQILLNLTYNVIKMCGLRFRSR